MGPAGCGGCISPGVDATAATDVPFERKHLPRQAPAVLYSGSAGGAGRGHPTPTPRVCAGLSGPLGGNRPSCRAQPLRRAGARRLSSVWDGTGAQLGKNPSAAGGGGWRGGDMPSYRLFCKPLKGPGVGVGNCPSCTLTQAPADEGEGSLGWRLSHRQAGSIRAQPRSDPTSQPSTVSQAFDQWQ